MVDKYKIRRKKSCIRTDLKTRTTNEEMSGLYFKWQKRWYFVEKVNTKYFLMNRKKHYSLIQEPGPTYVGHVSPFSSSSTNITWSIISHLSKFEISLEKQHVIGCDGTVTNSGWKNGIIRQLELHMGRLLQWRICLLHFNELPFRYIFQHIDGAITGPKSFSGPIRRCILGVKSSLWWGMNLYSVSFQK